MDRAELDTSQVGRNLLRFAAWGALWGLVLGFGLLAPGTLLTHRLRPLTVGQWFWLDAGLALILGSGGVLLAAPILLFGTDVLRWMKFRIREPMWAIGLVTGPVLVIAYAILAWLIGQYYLFDQATKDRSLPPAPLMWVVALVVVLAALWFVYRSVLVAKKRPPIQLLVWALVLTTGLELARLPDTVPMPPRVIAAAAIPLGPGRDSTPAPLLFVGLDAGNWASFDRLISAHQLPTFEALASSGVRGEVEAGWPPFWSSVAWAAIVTGQPRELFGMYEDLSAELPGLPLFQAPLEVTYWAYPLIGVRRLLVEAGILRLRLPPRDALARPPFWELFTLSGRPIAVVRMPYSYPADQRHAAVVISDWVGIDWQAVGVTTDGEGPFAVPASEKGALLKPFIPSDEIDRKMTAELFPSGMPSLSKGGQAALEEMRRGFILDVQTFTAARQIAHTHPGMNVALYLGGWDTANHAVSRYPDSETIADQERRADARAFIGVLDRYLMFLDRNLQQILASFASTPNVVVVSDHGFSEAWHDKHAMFLASGPGVSTADTGRKLTYFDVVPTLLDLQGLAKPDSLPGKSIFSK